MCSIGVILVVEKNSVALIDRLSSKTDFPLVTDDISGKVEGVERETTKHRPICDNLNQDGRI